MNYLKKLEDEVSAWPNGELGLLICRQRRGAMNCRMFARKKKGRTHRLSPAGV
jgi:hypothetical protein